jgi:predicted RND superfamily exporter protein
MLANFYQKNIIEKPKLIFLILLIFLIGFGYCAKNFKLDASSETLLIEGDPDLEYLNEITKRYGAREFLVLTYTPMQDMISPNSINNLKNLKDKISSLDWVHSVITLLDIPLLSSSDKPLVERLQNFQTLKNDDIDKKRGFDEIVNSPVFRNFVVSEDGKTSGIIIYLKSKDTEKKFKNKYELEKYKDDLKKKNHENILEIRKVIKEHLDQKQQYHF